MSMNKYFTNCATIEDVKATFKILINFLKLQAVTLEI